MAAALTRSKVKAAAQALVPQGYQLLANPPDVNPVDFTRNRATELLTKSLFLYDPSWTNVSVASLHYMQADIRHVGPG